MSIVLRAQSCCNHVGATHTQFSLVPLSGVARGGGGGGGGGGVNFPINLRCYVLLGCRVINVILAINIGDSAF